MCCAFWPQRSVQTPIELFWPNRSKICDLRLACLPSRLLPQEALLWRRTSSPIPNGTPTSSSSKPSSVASFEGIVAFDSQGKLYFANSAALDLYGLTRRDLRGNVHDLDPLFELYDFRGRAGARRAVPHHPALAW